MHWLTYAPWLAAMGALVRALPGKAVDARRFRPNVVVAATGEGVARMTASNFPEAMLPKAPSSMRRVSFRSSSLPAGEGRAMAEQGSRERRRTHLFPRAADAVPSPDGSAESLRN